ncbi:Polyamine transporter RMV1 [Hibiscus syriacus]|uniref:Polyamine transporter RMV1 n=1 Tax=Hibiscus syriacus TaxID=106335 RepID=A0A6A2ZSC4_HIBSY|nr:Polyamine transporter RMV1 [Hibiscus syriacus]
MAEAVREVSADPKISVQPAGDCVAPPNQPVLVSPTVDDAKHPNSVNDENLRHTSNTGASVAMGQSDGAEYVTISEAPTPTSDNFKKVSVLPLIFLIFYEVSGGPFGVEDSVNAAGPFLALLGFLVFPFIWSIPEALITAEMGTMFPENGGYVVWVSSALGSYWGFQQGWMKWLSGVIDNALYPGFNHCRMGCCASRGFLTPSLCGHGFVSIPKIEPSRWFVANIHDVDWNLYLNTLFWNLNYWDSISTLAGEVENPKKTLPKALFYALILVVLGYFFPLLVAAAMSNMGMFVAEMSSDSFQLLGMAERGMLPEFFSKRELLVLFGMILEFIAFVRLRMKYPAASRPYKIPVGTVGSILICIPPTILICVVLALSSLKVAAISLVAVIIGLVMQPGLKYVERKRWLKFSTSANLPDLHVSSNDDTDSIPR